MRNIIKYLSCACAILLRRVYFPYIEETVCRESIQFYIPTITISVADPDPGGSGFKSPGWIRIRIWNPDPGSEIEL